MLDGVTHPGLNDTAWLIDKVWRLTGGPAERPESQIILLPSGRIGAGWATGLIWWEASGGRLRLMDQVGTPRVAFTCPLNPSKSWKAELLPAKQNAGSNSCGGCRRQLTPRRRDRRQADGAIWSYCEPGRIRCTRPGCMVVRQTPGIGTSVCAPTIGPRQMARPSTGSMCPAASLRGSPRC